LVRRSCGSHALDMARRPPSMAIQHTPTRTKSAEHRAAVHRLACTLINQVHGAWFRIWSKLNRCFDSVWFCGVFETRETAFFWSILRSHDEGRGTAETAMTLNAPHGDDSAVPASSDFSGTIATPMRDRLLCAVAAASPCSKGKMPMQLPPPPPGMPASQVEKWRKEVAKIVSKQVRGARAERAPLLSACASRSCHSTPRARGWRLARNAWKVRSLPVSALILAAKRGNEGPEAARKGGGPAQARRGKDARKGVPDRAPGDRS